MSGVGRNNGNTLKKQTTETTMSKESEQAYPGIPAGTSYIAKLSIWDLEFIHEAAWLAQRLIENVVAEPTNAAKARALLIDIQDRIIDAAPAKSTKPRTGHGVCCSEQGEVARKDLIDFLKTCDPKC